MVFRRCFQHEDQYKACSITSLHLVSFFLPCSKRLAATNLWAFNVWRHFWIPVDRLGQLASRKQTEADVPSVNLRVMSTFPPFPAREVRVSTAELRIGRS